MKNKSGKTTFAIIILLIICIINTSLSYAASDKKIKVSIKSTSFTYTGKVIKPKVTVKYGKKKLPAKNYKVVYPKVRKNVGNYTIKIKLKGKYKGRTLKGTKKVKFTIVPQVPSYNIVNDNGVVKVVFTKSKQTTGYQIAYKEDLWNSSEENIFTTSLNQNIDGLKDKVQYIFRVRAYKTVKGKKIWGDWSDSKYITKSGDSLTVIDEKDKKDNPDDDPDEDNDNNDKDKKKEDSITKYSYEIIPIVTPLNQFFYIKTDNPDPGSFRFIDRSTRYASSGGLIEVDETIYPDVVYEDSSTGRVNGGYIAMSGSVDGGTIILQERKTVYIKINDNPKDPYNTISSIDYFDTDVKYELPEIYDTVDYLINNYVSEDASVFDKISAVQSGLYDWVYYSGHYVAGKVERDENSYYGLTCGPYKDSSMSIISPYRYTNDKLMFISRLYPYIKDSASFPSLIAEAAKRIEPSVKINYSESVHSMISVSYNGEVRGYGGAGIVRGVSISENNIVHPFKFDNSENDAFAAISDLKSLRNCFIDYFDYAETYQIPDKLTWEEVNKTVGPEGSYASLYAGYKDSRPVRSFNYLFDKGLAYSHFKNTVGHLSNSWFDGRFFNEYELFDKGAVFEDTLDSKPDLVFKDYYCPLPDDGHDYTALIKIPDAEHETKFAERDYPRNHGYDAEAGIWKGILVFSYDQTSDSYKPSCFYAYDYSEMEDFSSLRYSGLVDGTYQVVYLNDEEFLDRMEITLEEAKSMNLDCNTNKDPEEYYIYDTQGVPGTYHKDN